MARRTTSYAMKVFKAALLTALCIGPAWCLPQPPVAEGGDSGDDRK